MAGPSRETAAKPASQRGMPHGRVRPGCGSSGPGTRSFGAIDITSPLWSFAIAPQPSFQSIDLAAESATLVLSGGVRVSTGGGV